MESPDLQSFEGDGTVPEERVTVTDGQIYTMLIEQKGNISATARELSVRRSTLKERIDKSAPLVALLNDMREGAVDQAEQNQFSDVEKGDGPASRFLLTTLGKDRGYTAGVSGNGKGGEIVVQIKSFSENPDGA